MPDVEFQAEKSLPQAREFGVQGLYGFVIKLGLAKNEKEAGIILVAIAVAAVILAVITPFLIGSSVTYTKPSADQIQTTLAAPFK